ncbi:MAG TPA: hypothetical protein VMR65_11340 [Candidatus Sulfotelmatobacter sp.]|jgi:hypothetical protein|nr:hypothetical protein [Candidatus Sulfotelmatobacter sp.]
MRFWVAAAVISVAACGVAWGSDTVPLYTNEDLDRMFGPPLPAVTNPVDKSTPADWAWVEGFLDRQYARIEADRQYDLQRRLTDLAEEHPYYEETPYLWTSGYPYYPGVGIGHGGFGRGGGIGHGGRQGPGMMPPRVQPLPRHDVRMEHFGNIRGGIPGRPHS